MRTLLTTEQEADASRLYLFEGDFGERGDKVFRDDFRACRKEYQCHHCCGKIFIGERTRVHVGKYGGVVMTFRYCPDCCLSMSRIWYGPDEDEETGFDSYEIRTCLYNPPRKGLPYGPKVEEKRQLLRSKEQRI